MAIALGAAWYFWPKETDEDRVRAVVRELIAGAEAGDVGDILDHVSKDFQGREGGEGIDKPTLKLILVSQFMRRGPLGVFVAEILVNVRGETAHAAFDALLTEHAAGWKDIVPVNADGWHFEVDFSREEGAWMLIGAERSKVTLLR